MKRKLITTMMLFLTLTVMAFTLVSVPAVSAQPNKPLRCEVWIELVFVGGVPHHWEGTITGDIVGELTITPIAASFPGITEHYSETWDIVTAAGSIEIYQEGVWSFKSFKFKSNGWVTDATGTWEYLVGSDVHVRGVTSPFPAAEVTGTGTMWICGFGP